MRPPVSRSTHAVRIFIAFALWCGLPIRPAMADSAAPPNHDPIERINRAIFWFNDQVDTYALVPVAKGYDKITPARVKQCVSNFFQNLRFPLSAGNDLLQGKLIATAQDVGRFTVNTTVGFAGFFDPATGWGMQFHDEDFGQTLGYWGVPAGPYLVLPFWGPSNIRDAVGLAADSASTVYPWFICLYYSFGAQGVKTINGRALVLREVQQLKEASVDYYAAVRNAYLQRRESLIEDRTGLSQQEQEDLYNVDTNGGN